MAAWKDRWPLARRWAFLKRPLLALPQNPHSMEVDFCPLPDIFGDEGGFWLGLVVVPGLDLILAKAILDERPFLVPDWRRGCRDRRSLALGRKSRRADRVAEGPMVAVELTRSES